MRLITSEAYAQATICSSERLTVGRTSKTGKHRDAGTAVNTGTLGPGAGAAGVSPVPAQMRQG